MARCHQSINSQACQQACHGSCKSRMAWRQGSRVQALALGLTVDVYLQFFAHISVFWQNNSQFSAGYSVQLRLATADPSRELCSQVLQYDERILTRLSDGCAPHTPCYTGTPIRSDPKTIVEQSCQTLSWSACLWKD